jgi:hypothetical protein
MTIVKPVEGFKGTEEIQIRFQVTDEEELFAHRFPGLPAQTITEIFVPDPLNDSRRRLFDRGNAETLEPVLDPIADSSYVSPDEHSSFPHGLALLTVSPNPSLMDFCGTTVALRCRALTWAVSW